MGSSLESKSPFMVFNMAIILDCLHTVGDLILHEAYVEYCEQPLVSFRGALVVSPGCPSLPADLLSFKAATPLLYSPSLKG